MKDKALIGVSTDVEQPLDGALDPQEKPKKCHRILLGASATLLVGLNHCAHLE